VEQYRVDSSSYGLHPLSVNIVPDQEVDIRSRFVEARCMCGVQYTESEIIPRQGSIKAVPMDRPIGCSGADGV